jgi:indolepyruvate decarboxylase
MSGTITADATVASYLKIRLEQLGLDRMFGVAGNYTAALLDTILADHGSPITISSNPNEICAGYAADAYARYQGLGALYVTYSVGAFSLLNTIAGSYTERVPVLLVNGAPTNKEASVEQNAGLLYSHTTGYEMVDIHMFRPITAAAERITNARQAPYQIDSVLTAMLTERRPGYLEVAEDVWRAPCCTPEGTLSSGAGDYVTSSETDQAVDATMALLSIRPRIVLWAGVELQRFGLQDEFLALLDAANGHSDRDDPIRFVTTASSKSVVSEDHPLFEGCVTLRTGEIRALVGDDGVLVGLGGWTTSKNTGSENIRGPGTILAANGNVMIGAQLFPLVDLASYIAGLTACFRSASPTAAGEPATLRRLRVPESIKAHRPSPQPPASTARATPLVSYDDFFDQLDRWLTEKDILVVDAGFPLIGAQGVHIAARNGFVAQAAWLAIGYSVAAATGVKCANPNQRAVVVVGDGAFHETCQAVSDHHNYGHDTVVFVLSNGLYGIEQFIVNPNPFRRPPHDYEDHPLQNSPYSYNRLPQWNFVALTEGFGGIGRAVSTPDELAMVLSEIRATPNHNFVVEVRVPETSIPHGLQSELSSIGEDETAHPDWPPASKF